MSSRGMLWPTLATLAGLAILTGLGTWQLQRLHWKEGLIAKIATRTRLPPTPLQDALSAAAELGDDVEYIHVTSSGHFRNDLERFVYSPGPQGSSDWGYHVITPFELPDGRIILVNRGYVPRHLKDAATRKAGLLSGDATVTGLLRSARNQRPWYIPAADPKTLTWSWPEAADIAHSMYADHSAEVVTEFLVEADATAGIAPPNGGATSMTLSNRHLEYALTWYALAATLAGIYGVAWIRRFRAAHS